MTVIDKHTAKECIKPIGLYVHIPFCKQKCLYCDFCSSPHPKDHYLLYVDSLLREIDGYSRSKKIKVDTLFFGGGTPSLLSHDQFERLVMALKKTFDFSLDTEFTVEVNPKTLSLEKLNKYKDLGVNRLSIGLQSIHENELKKLGRIHSFHDFLKTYDMVRAVGFDNINIDVMYGIPEQTMESFASTLRKVTELKPTHISCYGLIVEPGTPFYKMADSLGLPDEDTDYNMYRLACSVLGEAGYSHYEISNYAKDRFECRHNLKYWRDEEYIGIGISAHSYYEGRRFYNVSDISEYFDYKAEKIRLKESDTVGIDNTEYIMLRLRLKSGIDFSDYQRIFCKSFLHGREEFIDKLISSGLAILDDAGFRLTEKGFYLSNSIISALV